MFLLPMSFEMDLKMEIGEVALAEETEVKPLVRVEIDIVEFEILWVNDQNLAESVQIWVLEVDLLRREHEGVFPFEILETDF